MGEDRIEKTARSTIKSGCPRKTQINELAVIMKMRGLDWAQAKREVGNRKR